MYANFVFEHVKEVLLEREKKNIREEKVCHCGGRHRRSAVCACGLVSDFGMRFA